MIYTENNLVCTCREGIADVIQKLSSLGVYGDQIALITRLDRTRTEHVDTWQDWWLNWLQNAGITREQELTAVYNVIGLFSAKACNIRLYDVVSEYEGPILVDKTVDVVQVSKLASLTKSDLYKDIVSKLSSLYQQCVAEGILSLPESDDCSSAIQLELRQFMWKVTDSVYASTKVEVRVTDDSGAQSVSQHI
jgi:hypothetical protein